MTREERATLGVAVSELANAVQVLSMLSTRLRQSLGAASEDAVKLDAAVEKAVRVLRHLQPKGWE